MAKQAITIVASEDTYKNLQTFENIKQLNEAVRTYKELYQDKLTKTAFSVLELLQGYSAKFTGVSFLTKNSIAKVLGKSRRTIIRACQLLEQLGIIRQYEMKRKTDMQQTSNAIVIQPVREEKAEVVTQEKTENVVESSSQKKEMSHQRKQVLISKTKSYTNQLNVKRSPYIKFVPKSLQHFQFFFGNQIKDLYGRVWLAAKKLNVTVDQETMQIIGFKAMDQLKQYLKNGNNLGKEELCKLAYTIAYNQLQQRLDRGDILDWNYEAKRLFSMLKK